MNVNVKISGFADEIDPSFEKQMNTLNELGISYIEVRGVDGKGLVNYTLDEVRAYKAKMDSYGVKASSIGSPIGKIKITDPFEEHFELYKHTVEIAKIMETPYIRMFSFFIPEGEDPYQYRDEVMARLQKFVDYAKENGVILLHENEKDIYGDNAPRCKEIMERFYGESFKAVFDFANYVQVHQETTSAFEMMKPYVEYIHIKDAMWDGGKVVPAGEGDGNVEKILTELLGEGYEGYLSLEPHLYDFSGLASLENGREDSKEEVPEDLGAKQYARAYEALKKILKKIEEK